MKKMNWEEHVENRKKWLAQPFMEMFDENTFRIRRNLLAISVVALIYKFAADGISEKSSFLGVQLEGLKTSSIDIILALGVIYFLVHFIWSALDGFQEWRLRLTGMAVAKPRHGMQLSDGTQAGSDDQRQATLSGWWATNIKQAEETAILLTQYEKLSEEETDKQQVAPAINGIHQNIEKVIERGAHIEAGLFRYEKGFYGLQKSQSWRWLIIEFSLPIALGIFSLTSLYCNT